MTEPRHSWTLGSLDLVTNDLPEGGFWFYTLADGLDIGAAEGARVVRESLLFDGDDVHVDRWSNRQIRFTVVACGWTWGVQGPAERALNLELEKANSPLRTGNTLRWVPPDQYGPATRFEVRAASMRMVTEGDANALDWVRPGVKYWTYEVTLDCAPWGYADFVVEETFTRASGSTTIVDDCASAAAWPGLTAGSYVGESVVSTAATIKDDLPTWYDITTTNSAVGTYGYWDVAFEGGSGRIESGALVGVTPSTAGGFSRYVFSGGFMDRLRVYPQPANATTPWRMHVHQVGTLTTLPSASSLVLPMQGSVRTQARLRILTGGGGGNHAVFVYHDPSLVEYGWDPATSDTWEAAPEGEYVVWMKPAAGVNAVGDDFAVTVYGQTATTEIQWTDDRWFPVGPFTLGGRMDRRLGAADDSNAPSVTKNGAAHTPQGLRLFREAEETGLFYIRGMATATENYLFIDPPTLDTSRPGVFASASSDSNGTNAVSVMAKVESWAWPVFYPPVAGLYVYCTNSTNPEVKVIHRPAFHTFAAAKEVA